MSTPFTYKDLETWQLGMDLVEHVYRVTATFPKFELYGLTGQVRRAAVSIPTNVAEGHCRRSTKAYANHVSIALGSHGELETCVEIASRLKFLPARGREELLVVGESVGRLLNGLHRSLEIKIAREAGE